jgi:hypothetical protein
MGQGNVGYGFDFRQFQYTQIGLPLVEPIKWIVVGAQVLRHPGLLSNGTVEHPTKGETIDGSRLDAEPDDPARVFITVSSSIVVLGILAAGTFQSHLVARATGSLCVPVGLIAGTIVGWSHAGSQRKREPSFPSLSIRG